MVIQHIKKLCVGLNHIDQLRDWQSKRGFKGSGGFKIVCHLTRATPKKHNEILAGGSLYWIIKGWIIARNPIVGLEPVEDEEGRKKCSIVLKCGPIAVVPIRHRPFQGWRYLNREDAPQDLSKFNTVSSEPMPPEMAAKLNELGLI